MSFLSRLVFESFFFLKRLTRFRITTAGPALAVMLLFCAVLAFGGYKTLTLFANLLAHPSELHKGKQLVRGGSIAADLFVDLADANLLRFDRSSLSVRSSINCAEFQRGIDDGRNKSLKARFCGGDIGNIVREEIAQTATERRVVAVRDNRRRGNTGCASEDSVVHYVPVGCFPNEWSGATADPGEKLAVTGELAKPQAAESDPKSATSTGNLAGTATLPPADSLAGFSTLVPVIEASPAPDVYGFIARDLLPGFGDWRRFKPLSNVIDVTSVVDNTGNRSKKLVSVDYVGRLISSQMRSLDTGELFAPDGNRILCESFRTEERCLSSLAETAHDIASAQPYGGRLTFAVPGSQKMELTLRLSPSAAAHPRVRALADVRVSRPREMERLLEQQTGAVPLSNHIRMRCRKVSATAALLNDQGNPYFDSENSRDKLTRCALAWLPNQPRLKKSLPDSVVDSRELIIESGDDTPLALTEVKDIELSGGTSKRTVISAEAVGLGLLPVIGFDQRDAGGAISRLIAPLRQGERTRETLTIRAPVQAVVQETLQDVLAGNPGFSDITARLLPNRRSDRLANVVLMDAGPAGAYGDIDWRTGEVIAVGSLPAATTGMHEWDILANQQFRPTESRIAARAWSQNNRLYAPGSSFKTVVTLAAIRAAANGQNTIARYLGATADTPGMTREELDRTIGNEFGFRFDAKSLSVPINSGGTTGRSRDIGNRKRAMCDRIANGQCKPTARLTMPDMLASSDNVYFSRLALLLDEDHVSSIIAGRRVESRSQKGAEISISGGDTVSSLRLQRTLDYLWPREAADLLPGVDPYSASRLNATPGLLDARLLEGPRLFRLAQNGIGQGAQMTPLAMASIAGGISAGQRILPSLLKDRQQALQGAPLIAEDPVEPGGSFSASRAAEMLESLRQGMRNVFQFGTGAKAPFAAKGEFTNEALLSLRDRLYGKTGTAQQDNPGRDGITVWMVGWIERPDITGFEDRRIAFACMLTHARPDTAGGGSTCGPLMTRLFARLAARPETGAASAGKSSALEVD